MCEQGMLVRYPEGEEWHACEETILNKFAVRANKIRSALPSTPHLKIA